MTERARDYVKQYLAEKYTPEEIGALNKRNAEFLESIACSDDHPCKCEEDS